MPPRRITFGFQRVNQTRAAGNHFQHRCAQRTIGTQHVKQRGEKQTTKISKENQNRHGLPSCGKLPPVGKANNEARWNGGSWWSGTQDLASDSTGPELQ